MTSVLVMYTLPNALALSTVNRVREVTSSSSLSKHLPRAKSPENGYQRPSSP